MEKHKFTSWQIMDRIKGATHALVLSKDETEMGYQIAQIEDGLRDDYMLVLAWGKSGTPCGCVARRDLAESRGLFN